MDLHDPGFELIIEKISKHPKFRLLADKITFELLAEREIHYKIGEQVLEELLKEIFDDLDITQEEIEEAYDYSKETLN